MTQPSRSDRMVARLRDLQISTPDVEASAVVSVDAPERAHPPSTGSYEEALSTPEKLDVHVQPAVDSWVQNLWTATLEHLLLVSVSLALGVAAAIPLGVIMARDAGAPALKLQSLVYPVVDYRLTDASYERYATGYGILTKNAMAWFQRHYLRDAADADDWRASPIKAANLAGVAPAIIIAAECDVLCDEGKRYAAALTAAGVPVQRHEFAGMVHGLFWMVSVLLL